MRVGVFGGSFNPPHIGHLIVAEHAREAASLDEILWIPAFVSPLKAPAGFDVADRLAMVRLATDGNPVFKVSSMEIDRGGASYTIDTLRALKNQRPKDDLFLLIGMDSLTSFDRWREPAEIVKLAKLVVYPRKGYTENMAESRLAEHSMIVEAPEIDISSTDLRRRIADGRSVRYLMPEKVQQYVLEKGLYAVAT